MHVTSGDVPGGRSFLEKCVATEQTTFTEYFLAQAELARLK